MASRGHKPGQAGVALDWAGYVDGLTAEHGSLARVAEVLAASRAYRDDLESITRALRRLRARGAEPGGTWGDRLLATFGLPRPVEDRLRFMGSYHARFVDLPVPLCLDLIQLWDRPPTSASPSGRAWLSLARATVAMRSARPALAAEHLATAATVIDPVVEPAAAIERALAQAVLDGDAVEDDGQAEAIAAWLERVDGADRACLRARWVGQRAHALNRRGQVDAALALHTALPDGDDVPPFARSRRANGLAYGHHRRGEREPALTWARASATYAGDAGHVRLRAMALLMVARVAGDDAEGRAALGRASAMAEALDDEILRTRCAAARVR